MPEDHAVDSTEGKKVIAYAMNAEHCVLEFNEMDDGSMRVADITDHVRQLERMHVSNDPAQPMDK